MPLIPAPAAVPAPSVVPILLRRRRSSPEPVALRGTRAGPTAAPPRSHPAAGRPTVHPAVDPRTPRALPSGANGLDRCTSAAPPRNRPGPSVATCPRSHPGATVSAGICSPGTSRVRSGTHPREVEVLRFRCCCRTRAAGGRRIGAGEGGSPSEAALGCRRTAALPCPRGGIPRWAAGDRRGRVRTARPARRRSGEAARGAGASPRVGPTRRTGC